MKHTLRSREIDGLGIAESLYPARLRQPRHTHSLASFSFVLAGSYVEVCGAKAHTREPSTIVFHPPQESHAVEYSNAVRILSVRMNARRFSYLKDHAVVFDSRANARSATIDWLGHRLYREFRRADSVSALALEGLVFEILAETSRANQVLRENAPRWLREAENFLHDNFSNSFSCDDVAMSAGVHPVHLARVFRKTHGCTIGDYVRRLRLDFAAKEIVTTRTLLADIAVAAGFADQSHLTRTFKARFGLTPSDYRKCQNRLR